MPVDIERMNGQVEILRAESGNAGRSAGGGGDPSSARNMRELKEMLRPLVMELIAEELESYMRMRG